jgi:hypothetical protein
VDVPSGVTLTIEPGTVIKAFGPDNPNDPGSITVEGTLDAAGTSAQPVTFTSANDNSVGGDTGTGSPAAGDWDGIWVDNGSVDIEHAVLSYASTALSFGGTTGLLSSVTISDSTLAVQATAGALSLRGTLSADTSAVKACDWGAGCSVDATYTDWGNGSYGPFPENGSTMVCGDVLVSPWISESGTSAAAFGSRNCDGSAAPDQQVSIATQQFDEDLDGVEVQCGDGYQTFCAEAQTALSCLSAAQSAAEANSPVPLTNEQTADDFASEAIDKLSDYLADSASSVVSDLGQVTGFAGQMLDVIDRLASLASAYDQCDP